MVDNMEWFNVFGLIFIAVIMIPNVVFAIKCKDGFDNKWNNVEVTEQFLFTERMRRARLSHARFIRRVIFLKNEIVLFTDGDINIEVELSPELETVWLTQKQMGELFEVKQATLSEHINNIISSGELDETSIGFSDKSSGGRKPKIYNLDMILSVGYRVNSKRGIAFRRWANSVLKKYVIQGYAINEKRLQALERTVDIQTKMLASTLEVEESDILKAVTSYTDALMLLDQYDHQSLKKPVGNRPIYKITYEECKKMVSHMEDSFKSLRKESKVVQTKKQY